MAVTKSVMSALVVGVLLISSQNSFLSAGDDTTWPQWRGPRRDGSVIGGSWPNTLQAAKCVSIHTRCSNQAGAAGLELATPGFGDRCSAN